LLDFAAVSCELPAMRLDIKICGLKTPEAVAAALRGGASHLGFIFFARSPRNIDGATAGGLRQAAIGRSRAVAVTVDASDHDLDGIVASMRPDVLQLHGAETPDRVAAVRRRYGLPVIKAIAVREAADLEAIRRFREVADRLLFDAKPPVGTDLPGGNGRAFDWRLLANLDAELDYMLSGGINAANVGEALSAARPGGIDVSSGLESAPGDKDPALIDAFFRAVEAVLDGRPICNQSRAPDSSAQEIGR
jgi:phosphoribosylanthranilate isomerase